LAKIFSNLYKLYTSDLKDGDVQRLIRSEAPEVYQFYLESAKKRNYAKMNKEQKTFALIKDIVYAFLSKLSPVRRIAFSLAFVIFFYAYLANLWFWAVLSFFTIVALLAFEVAEKLTAANELDIAKGIQEELIMKEPPQYEKLQVASYSKPAKTVGGDFLNWFHLNHEKKRHLYLLGDISGKGMLAALYMVRVHSLLMYLTKEEENSRNILVELNKVLNAIFKPGLFFTAAGVEVENENELKLFRAGHMPFVHYDAEKKEVLHIKPDGIGIGMRDKGIFEKSLKEHSLTLKQGDILLVYSDGLNEAVNEHGHEYGTQRIEKNIIKYADKSAEEFLQMFVRSVNNFTYNVPMRDDITILVMKAEKMKAE